MFIANLRITYERIPTKIREKYAFSKDVQSRIIRDLLGTDCITESAILITCNRTELYLVGNDLEKMIDSGLNMLEVESEEKNTKKYVEVSRCIDAVEHLFEVSAGLDSMILGETEILGQIKKSYEFAKENGTIGNVLNLAFKRAIRVGKKVRQETGISRGRVSIGTAAIELAGRIMDIRNKRVMLVGAGKMGSLIAKTLVDSGVRDILIVSRTNETARELADKIGCKAIGFNELHENLKGIDLLITATNSPHTIFCPDSIDFSDRYKPLYIIDVAVPRDVDPVIGKMDNVELYSIESLEGIAKKNRDLRRKEAEKARKLIAVEVDKTRNKLNKLHIESLIGLMRQNVESIRRKELMRAINILSNSKITERDMMDEITKVMDDLTNSLVNKILHNPIEGIRNNPEINDVQLVRDLFLR